MDLVSELDLPAFDYSAPDFSADQYHQQLAETRQRGWLAKSPLAYIVLDHDAGEFFLRSRKTAFPGRQPAAFFGVTGGPRAPPPRAGVRGRRGRGGSRGGWGERVPPRPKGAFAAAVAQPYPSLTI